MSMSSTCALVLLHACACARVPQEKVRSHVYALVLLHAHVHACVWPVCARLHVWRLDSTPRRYGSACGVYSTFMPYLYLCSSQVSSTVSLHSELSHMETYVQLPGNYSLIGQDPGSPPETRAKLGLAEEYSDAWAATFRQLFAPHQAQHLSASACVARGRAVTWAVPAQCEGAPARAPQKLMVVAHPDDETFFGFSALASAAHCGEWLVLCVTNASPNSSYPEGKCATNEINRRRRFEFEKAIQLMGAQGEMWDFQDRFTGFTAKEQADLARALIERFSSHSWLEVATHSAQGEYGHAQHRQLHALVRDAIQTAARSGSTTSPRLLTFHLDASRAPAPSHVQQKQVQIATQAYPQRVVHLHKQLSNWTKFGTLAAVDTRRAAAPQTLASVPPVSGGMKSAPPAAARRAAGTRHSQLKKGGGAPTDDTATGLSDMRWTSELDRHYMKHVMFPRAGELAGMDGKVLDVGYMRMNADDRLLAGGVDASRWYFIEPEPVASFDPRSGVLLVGRLDNLLATRPALRASFRVIIDYGVLGWTMCRNRTACNMHVDGLSQLLAPGGTLLLKFDCKSYEQLDWWAATRTKLQGTHLQLADMSALYAASCSSAHLDRLKQEGGIEPRNYTDGIRVRSSRCQAYFMMEWRKWPSNGNGGGSRGRGSSSASKRRAQRLEASPAAGGRGAHGGQQEQREEPETAAVVWGVRIAGACLAALAVAWACCGGGRARREPLLMARTALLVLLVVQSTSAVLLMRYSSTRAVVGPRYLPSAAVMMAEVLKLPVCVSMAAWSVGPSRLPSLLVSEILSPDGRRATLRCAIPALAFTVQGNLLFVALAHLEAVSYVSRRWNCGDRTQIIL